MEIFALLVVDQASLDEEMAIAIICMHTTS